MSLATTCGTDPGLSIHDAAIQANSNAKVKGFWEQPYLFNPRAQVAEKLLLIVSEVSECTEILRFASGNLSAIYEAPDGKPEGFVYELADIIIRTLDLAQNFDLDIEKAVIEKMAFNSGRPYKHGKNF